MPDPLHPTASFPRSSRLPAFVLLLCLGLLPLLGSHVTGMPGFRQVAHLISPAAFARLDPVHRRMLLSLAAQRPSPGRFPAAACWAEGTDPEVIAAFERARRALVPLSPDSPLTPSAYHEGFRWSETATDGPGLGEKDPTVLTWGILPDGVQIGSWNGEPPSYSRLIQIMDGLHGEGPGGDDLTQRPWFPLVEGCFLAWGRHIGVKYVYEPNDDRAAFPDSPGELGVRPDIRIGAHPIDGEDGVYGMDEYPNISDMLLDSQDRKSIFGAAGYDYLMLRNLIGHEHGHGLGLTHACANDGTSLMDPTIRAFYDGPQENDIIFVILGYGDRWEIPGRNDTPGTAYDLGTVLPGDTVLVDKANIDSATDEDYFGFSVTGRMRVTIHLVPTGESLYRSPNEDCYPWRLYEASKISDLTLSLLSGDGSLLTTANAKPAGGEELLPGFIVPGEGAYFVRVTGDPAVNEPQRYEVELSVDAGTAPVALCKDRSVCRNTLIPYQLDDGSYDPDGDPLELRLDPPGPYPPGENHILFIVDDGALTDTCEAVVHVNSPPVAACRSLSVDAEQCSVTLPASLLDDGSYDPDGGALTFALDPPGPFGSGTTPVKFLVTDTCGAADTCETTILVGCTVPVQLLTFEAERRGSDVLVRWKIAGDEAGARFHVYREDGDGARQRVTDVPLSGRSEYTFRDPAVPAGSLRYWLEETDRTGETSWHGPVEVEPAAIAALRVSSLAPNPFTSTTGLEYSLPTSLPVRITVYDVRGRRVRLLTEGLQPAGSHRAEWDGTAESGIRLPAGLYLLRVEAGDRILTRKVVYSP